jgi:transposase
MKLSDESQAELVAMAGSGDYDRSERARAQLVLWRRRDGLSVVDVAKKAGVSRPTVYTWLDRFDAEGAGGLIDRPKPGRPRVVTGSTRARILALSKQTPPEETGLSHWSAAEMSRYLAAHEDIHVSANFVSVLWRDNGFRPHRQGTFKISSDPQFEAKVVDVVGLYLDPPAGAVVLSVDEKTQVQALDRTQPLLPMTFFKEEKRTADYVRHGTTNLFAALNTATGEVTAECYQQRRAVEFVDFLDKVVQEYPDTQIHLICDNLSTHKSEEADAWRAKQPEVTFHYTPVGSSWLNQVETWFSIITAKTLRRGTFRSVKQLIKTIRDYTDHWNEHARPFAWVATAADIIEKVQILQRDWQQMLDCNRNHV